MKLESLIKKVEELELVWDLTKIGNSVFITRVLKYVNFLKQPLTLGMFVPCDLDGNVLKEPILTYPFSTPRPIDERNFERREKEYQQAQERVLFKGLSCRYIDKGNGWHLVKYENGSNIWASYDVHETIDTLLRFECLELTPNAIKQLK